MTLKLDVTPSAHLRISLARQAQIIEAINAKLASHPRQGFCFMGSPGTGKTYLMKAIQRWVAEYYRLGMTQTRPYIYKLTTLAEWQEANLGRARGETISPLFDAISAKRIRKVADNNAMWSGGAIPWLHESLHFFIDEFDSQPTVSKFSSSKLQTFVNACYDNAPRTRPGNEADFVQLVVAMNKSWAEFESAYGIHVARRIAEMCVRIDFDKAEITEPPPDRNMPDAIDLAIEGMFSNMGIDPVLQPLNKEAAAASKLPK
jgi:hypothetical protein